VADERRYNDDEVAAIFEAASVTPVSRGDSGAADGLTLAELQAIGREVGIAPDRIAEAAVALQRSQPPIPRRTELGMPLSAAHIVEIPRPLTDREWSLVVADLRETFGARGRESSYGETREWANGNLHAYVEPTRTGYRLRLGTVKGDALALNRMGAFGIAMSAVVGVASLLSGDPSSAVPGVVALGSMGAGAFVINALRLPRWARLREQQMKGIAERTRALVGAAADADPGAARAARLTADE
jgi:hypothetical protein